MSHKITSSLLARNVVLNIIGQIVPLLVAVATIPYIILRLAAECFGILSRAWVVAFNEKEFDGRFIQEFLAST
jgi:hypothetical protein